MELNPWPQHEKQHLSHLSHKLFVIHETQWIYIPPSAPVIPNMAGIAQTLPHSFFLPTTTINDATHPPLPSKTMSAGHTMRMLTTHGGRRTHNVCCHQPPTTPQEWHQSTTSPAPSMQTQLMAGEDNGDEVMPSPGKQTQPPSQPPFWHPPGVMWQPDDEQQHLSSFIVFIYNKEPQHPTTMQINSHEEQPLPPPTNGPNVTAQEWTRPPTNECHPPWTNATAHKRR